MPTARDLALSALVLFGAQPTNGHAQAVDTAALQSVVSREILASAALSSRIRRDRSLIVEVSRDASMDADSVWVGTVANLTHWPFYVIEVSNGHVHRLGGFRAPEVEEYWQTHPPLKHADTEAVLARTRQIAVLLGRSIGPDCLLPWGVLGRGDRVPRAFWELLRNTGWPADTVQPVSSNEWVSIATAVCSDPRGYDDRWTALAVAVLLDKDGAFLAWSSRAQDKLAR